MKRLKSIGSSVGGFILIILVYLIVNMFIAEEDATLETLQPSTAIELVEQPVTGQSTGATTEALEVDDNIHEVTIDRVVDGDTIVVEMNGDLIKVRFSGVNTPESVGDYEDNPQFYGKEASAYTRAILKEGLTIYLEEDVKPYDKYDRYLAYIWLEYPSEDNFMTHCFNAMLIEQGYARWFNDYDNTKYAVIFENLEEDAQDQSLGMWQSK